MEENNKNSPAVRYKRRNKPNSATASTVAQPSAVLKPNANRRTAGANWNTVSKSSTTSVSVSMERENKTTDCNQNQNAKLPSAQGSQQKRTKLAQSDKYVAMDCEMVGVGFKGQDDMLARVSIVNRNGKVLLDKYVKPRDAITDYRTAVSGIRPCNLVNAEEFNAVQDEVLQLLQNRVLIGHNIRKDLQVLNIKHPYMKTRDTSNYKPLCRLVSNGRTPSLKRLSEAILGLQIQTGEHNSVEDARAAMSIYNRLATDWEQYLRTHGHDVNRRRR